MKVREFRFWLFVLVLAVLLCLLAAEVGRRLGAYKAERWLSQLSTAEASVPDTFEPGRPMRLPVGQKFVGFAPISMGDDPYSRPIVEPRGEDEAPRLLAVLKPGATPRSWVIDFYIQEQ